VVFEVDAWADDDAVRVLLRGELDLAAVPGLRAAMHEAVSTAAKRTVTVDLREVTFLDCAALGELVRGRNLALQRGLRYRVVLASGLPLQVMAMTGTLPVLTAP
jgi:anti-sigma B factor antagonist